jgi:hypothetical protein
MKRGHDDSSSEEEEEEGELEPVPWLCTRPSTLMVVMAEHAHKRARVSSDDDDDDDTRSDDRDPALPPELVATIARRIWADAHDPDAFADFLCMAMLAHAERATLHDTVAQPVYGPLERMLRRGLALTPVPWIPYRPTDVPPGTLVWPPTTATDRPLALPRLLFYLVTRPPNGEGPDKVTGSMILTMERALHAQAPARRLPGGALVTRGAFVDSLLAWFEGRRQHHLPDFHAEWLPVYTLTPTQLMAAHWAALSTRAEATSPWAADVLDILTLAWAAVAPHTCAATLLLLHVVGAAHMGRAAVFRHEARIGAVLLCHVTGWATEAAVLAELSRRGAAPGLLTARTRPFFREVFRFATDPVPGNRDAMREHWRERLREA